MTTADEDEFARDFAKDAREFSADDQGAMLAAFERELFGPTDPCPSHN